MEILKLTVKREAFENILAHKQGYVYLEANGYWIKRIAENKLANFNKLVASQAFKTYDEIEISCSKDKINCAFGAINTGKEDGSIKTSKDTGFVVTLGEFSGAQNTVKTVDEPEVEPVDVIEDEPEDAIETGEDVEKDINSDEQAPLSDADSDADTDEPEDVDDEEYAYDVDSDAEEEDDEPVNIDMLNDVVKDFIDTFDDGLWGNVYIVNRPLVIISGGYIVGTRQKVKTNNEEEIRIPIGKITIQDPSNGTNDVAFINEIEKKMYDLAMSGYVFIWKNECKIIQTENGRELLLRLTKKNILNR